MLFTDPRANENQEVLEDCFMEDLIEVKEAHLELTGKPRRDWSNDLLIDDRPYWYFQFIKGCRYVYANAKHWYSPWLKHVCNSMRLIGLPFDYLPSVGIVHPAPKRTKKELRRWSSGRIPSRQ